MIRLILRLVLIRCSSPLLSSGVMLRAAIAFSCSSGDTKVAKTHVNRPAKAGQATSLQTINFLLLLCSYLPLVEPKAPLQRLQGLQGLQAKGRFCWRLAR